MRRLACAVGLACATLVACRPAPPTADLLGPHVLLEGVQIELVASEPLVLDPVDLEFDAAGRAFVLEMPGYPTTVGDSDRPGRVVELIDEDDDGRFDRRRVFATELRYADSILPYREGLLIADAPDVLYVKDTDGDGRADLRQTVISGFAEGPSESQVNGLVHGPDNWIYGANGSSGGEIFLTGSPGERLGIRGQDFRFRFEPDPVDRHRLGNGSLESAGPMGGGFGVTFDDWGRRFVTHEQRHIQAVVVPRSLLPDGHAWPRTVVEISDHGRGGTTRIFPVSDTVQRPNHPEQAGYFTAGSGLTHYGGDALPDLRGSFFVGESVHNLVHRDVVEPEGSSFVARRAQERAEFLAVEDPAFRPVNFATGPDGALYVLDMQREVIEHPEWIPDDMEAGLDLRAGSDRGRIYRLSARAKQPVASPLGLERTDLGHAIDMLAHANQWRRQTAQRLLVEWQDDEAVPLLHSLFEQQAEPRARLHALWTLDGLGALDGAAGVARLEAALRDPHARVREAGLELVDGRLDAPFPARVVELTGDGDARVRFAALLQVGRMLDARSASVPVDAIGAAVPSAVVADLADPWMSVAAEAVAARRPSTVLPGVLEALQSQPGREGALALLSGLGVRIGERARLDEIEQLLLVMHRVERPERGGNLTTALARGLVDGLERRPAQLESLRRSGPLGSEARTVLETLPQADDPRVAVVGWRLRRALEAAPPASALGQRVELARQWLSDELLPIDRRVDELVLFATAAAERRLELLALLDPKQPLPVASAALDQLTASDDAALSAELATALIERWPQLLPPLRQKAGDFLLRRRSHHALLLDALEGGDIRLGELNLHLERRRTLLRWSTPEIGERAARLFSDSGVMTRAEAYERFRPAVELEGDAARGRVVFEQLCARCHQLDGGGGGLGPGLDDVFRKSAAALLHDIVDPNAAVSPEYVAYDLVLASGEILSGLLTDSGAGDFELRDANDESRTVARAEVEAIESSGLSLMPEALEDGLDLQGMADLLAHLRRSR